MSVTPMSAARRGVAHAAIAVVAGVSLACIATDREYWPFSPYPMFAELVPTQPYAEVVLVGVRREDGAEFSLRPHKYIRPFDWSRQRVALEQLLERPDGGAAVARALADCARRYEVRRVRHHGPALSAIRVYRLEWHHVNPRNSASVDVDRVDRRVLLAELTVPTEGR